MWTNYATAFEAKSVPSSRLVLVRVSGKIKVRVGNMGRKLQSCFIIINVSKKNNLNLREGSQN